MLLLLDPALAANQFILHFETVPGRFPDTKVVARAMLQWTEMLEASARALDPGEQIQLETIGFVEGSLRIPQILRFLERSVNNLDAAWADYPHLKRIALGSAHTITGAAVASLFGAVMEPSPPTVQTVQLSARDRAILSDMEGRIRSSAPAQEAGRRFYRELEEEPAIAGVGVSQGAEERPINIVPRDQFAERGGLWLPQQQSLEIFDERVREDIWDVVLLSAPFQGRPLAWRFSRDGLHFNAKMNDANFLLAVKEGRVPIALQEGVVLRVRVKFSERLHGQVWETIPRSREVIDVISPIPLPPGSQFPFPDKPRRD